MEERCGEEMARETGDSAEGEREGSDQGVKGVLRRQGRVTRGTDDQEMAVIDFVKEHDELYTKCLLCQHNDLWNRIGEVFQLPTLLCQIICKSHVSMNCSSRLKGCSRIS